MLPRLCLLALLAHSAAGLIGGERAASPKQLRQEKEFSGFLGAEKDLVAAIGDYVAKEEAKLDQLRALAKVQPTREAEYIRNPVNVFRLVNHLLHSKVLTLMRKNNADESLASLKERLPTHEHLEKAAREVFAWSERVGASTNDIADGAVADAATEPLEAADAAVLGRLAYGEGDFFHCAHWMEAALARLPEDADKAELFDVWDHLSHSYYRMGGNLQRAYHIIKHKILAMYPEHTRALENVEYLETELREAGMPLLESEADLPPVSYVTAKEARRDAIKQKVQQALADKLAAPP